MPNPPSTIEKSVDVVNIQFSKVGTIAGGFVGDDASSSARKRHYKSINLVSYLSPCLQPAITFLDTNFSINGPNQDDPVVITVTTATWRVHIILIDQESSANVLY